MRRSCAHASKRRSPHVGPRERRSNVNALPGGGRRTRTSLSRRPGRSPEPTRQSSRPPPCPTRNPAVVVVGGCRAGRTSRTMSGDASRPRWIEARTFATPTGQVRNETIANGPPPGGRPAEPTGRNCWTRRPRNVHANLHRSRPLPNAHRKRQTLWPLHPTINRPRPTPLGASRVRRCGPTVRGTGVATLRTPRLSSVTRSAVMPTVMPAGTTRGRTNPAIAPVAVR